MLHVYQCIFISKLWKTYCEIRKILLGKNPDPHPENLMATPMQIRVCPHV